MVSDRVAQVERILDGVMDPELPFLTITELGMIQGCDLDEDGTVVIKLTPTYSGCPATDAIQDDIKSALQPVEPRFRIDIVHAPAWTTDWISAEAREKMRLNGIAPPEGTSADKAFLLGKSHTVPCPRCASEDTRLVSPFGSTACKAHYQCNACAEPFDHFKCF
jgi:ring-1,2-phenylacetyl-CoA epoxidase subunit PaaD